MQFLGDEHLLCTADAMRLMEKLTLEHEPYCVYNRQMPRDEPGVTPFDRVAPKWRDRQFAVALDEDTDPHWEGFR
jgi:hypothetical protein